MNPPGEAERLLKRLEFTVIRRLDGMRQGEHQNVAYGAGLDLAELREYQLGDDVRALDWNVTARMGVPYVRRYHEDREVTAWLLMDVSASTDYGSVAQSKREVIVDLAATLGRLLNQRGDKVGALVYTGELDDDAAALQRRRAAATRAAALRHDHWWSPHARSRLERPPARVIPAGAGRTHTLQLLRRALDLAGRVPRPGEPHAPVRTDLERALEQAFKTSGRAGQRAVVFVLTDLLDDASSWERALGPLARRCEVVMVWVRDPTEAALPDVGVVTFEDAETGEQVVADTSQPALRAAYARLAEEKRQHVAFACGRAGATLWEVDSGEPLVPALVRLLDQRRRTAVGLVRLAAHSARPA